MFLLGGDILATSDPCFFLFLKVTFPYSEKKSPKVNLVNPVLLKDLFNLFLLISMP